MQRGPSRHRPESEGASTLKLQRHKADEGVVRGPGGPPHFKSRWGFLACVLAAASHAPLRADFSYQEATQIVGGAPQKPTTYLIKGNRVAALTKDHIRVTDIDREIVTEIDLLKKTYLVTTFAQIKQTQEDVDAKFKVSKKATGQSKLIGVLSADELLITMTREDVDNQIVIDSWMATVPGYDEVKEVQRKLGQKLGYAFGSLAILAHDGYEDMFDRVYKELNKAVGVPLEFSVRMGDAAAVSAPPPPPPAAATGVAGALGRLGGIAGLGHKKNTADQPAGSPSLGGLVETTRNSPTSPRGPPTGRSLKCRPVQEIGAGCGRPRLGNRR